MYILIPGGAGFVGKNLIQKLLNLNYKIIVIDKDNLNLKHENLLYFKSNLLNNDIEFIFKEYEINIVIDCIGRQYVNTKIPYFNRQIFFNKVNVGITKKLLDLSIKYKIKHFIFISTDMVYGIPKYLPLDEKHTCNPIGEYGISKLIAENLINTYSKNYNLNTLILRPRFIIGKGRGGVLETLIKLFNYNIPVPLFGNGKNHYQMINVDDLNNFIILSIEKVITGVVNIGSENPSLFIEFYKKIKNELNSKSPIIKTYHNFNKLIFKLLNIIGLPILYNDQYEIADKEYILNIDLAKSY